MSANRQMSDQEKCDLITLLRLPEFRRFISRELVHLLDRLSAVQSGSMTYFNDGERNIALNVKSKLVDADPDGWLEVLKTNHFLRKGK